MEQPPLIVLFVNQGILNQPPVSRAMQLAQLVRVVPTRNAQHANRDISCNLHLQCARIHAQRLDIIRTPLITFAQLAMLPALRVQARVILNAPLAIQGISCSPLLHQQLVSTLVQLDMVETLQLTPVYSAIFLVQVVLEQKIINVSHANQDIFCSQPPQEQLVLTVVQPDIGRTPLITFAQLAILLALSVQARVILNAPLAIQGIFCNRRRQHVSTLVHQPDIGRTPLITFAKLAMLLALCVQVQVILNALPANRDISYNQHLQPLHALTLVQMDMVKALQVTLAFSVILLVQFVWMGPTLNAPCVIQGIFYNHHQQYALTLARQPDIGRTTQITFVLLAMLLALCVQVQVILNALPANRGISYNQHLQPLHALTLVQMDIGETLQVTLVWNVIFHVRFVRMGPTLNAHLAIQDIFSS